MGKAREDVNNPVWTGEHGSKQRGGAFYLRWRKAVRKRDGGKCQGCDATDHVEAHHIDTWANAPERRFDIANGVLLCRTCHLRAHSNLVHNEVVQVVR